MLKDSSTSTLSSFEKEFFEKIEKFNNNNKSVEFGLNTDKPLETQDGEDGDKFINYFSKIFRNVVNKYCIIKKFNKFLIDHFSIDFDNANENFIAYCIYEENVIEPIHIPYKVLLLTNHCLAKLIIRNNGFSSFDINNHIVYDERDWIVLKRSIQYFSEIDRLFYNTISCITKQYNIEDVEKLNYFMASIISISIAIKTIRLDNGQYDTRMIFYCTTTENYRSIKSFNKNYDCIFRIDIPRDIINDFTRSHCYQDMVKEFANSSYCANNFLNLLNS